MASALAFRGSGSAGSRRTGEPSGPPSLLPGAQLLASRRAPGAGLGEPRGTRARGRERHAAPQRPGRGEPLADTLARAGLASSEIRSGAPPSPRRRRSRRGGRPPRRSRGRAGDDHSARGRILLCRGDVGGRSRHCAGHGRASAGCVAPDEAGPSSTSPMRLSPPDASRKPGPRRPIGGRLSCPRRPTASRPRSSSWAGPTTRGRPRSARGMLAEARALVIRHEYPLAGVAAEQELTVRPVAGLAPMYPRAADSGTGSKPQEPGDAYSGNRTWLALVMGMTWSRASAQGLIAQFNPRAVEPPEGIAIDRAGALDVSLAPPARSADRRATATGRWDRFTPESHVVRPSWASPQIQPETCPSRPVGRPTEHGGGEFCRRSGHPHSGHGGHRLPERDRPHGLGSMYFTDSVAGRSGGSVPMAC